MLEHEWPCSCFDQPCKEIMLHSIGLCNTPISFYFPKSHVKFWRSYCMCVVDIANDNMLWVVYHQEQRWWELYILDMEWLQLQQHITHSQVQRVVSFIFVINHGFYWMVEHYLGMHGSWVLVWHSSSMKIWARYGRVAIVESLWCNTKTSLSCNWNAMSSSAYTSSLKRLA